MIRSLMLAPLVLAAPAGAQGALWTVDEAGAPGSDFSSIQQAVDAANHGDAILIREGTYSPFQIVDKGLVVQGEGEVIVSAAGAGGITTLSSLSAGRFLGLRNLRFFSGELRITGCAGPVLLEDVQATEGPGDFTSLSSVTVEGCASVTLCRTVIEPRESYIDYFSFFGISGVYSYAGLRAIDSNLYLYDSTISGSSGQPCYEDKYLYLVPSSPGGVGVFLDGGEMLASGCKFAGGVGGWDELPWPTSIFGLCDGGDGGDGVLVDAGSSSMITHLDCDFLGGAGGVAGGLDGTDGQDIVAPLGAVVSLPGSSRSFHGDSPVSEGTTAALHLRGQGGDHALLHVQLSAAAGHYLPSYGVALHLPLPVAVADLGLLPTEGALDLPLTTPDLPSGIGALRAVAQVLFVSGGAFYDGGPSTMLLLNTIP